MMDLLEGVEADSLNALEERIHQAIGLVSKLRQERDDAVAEKAAAIEERDALKRQVDDRVAGLEREVESLRAERQQVRARIEKLLGQIATLASD